MIIIICKCSVTVISKEIWILAYSPDLGEKRPSWWCYSGAFWLQMLQTRPKKMPCIHFLTNSAMLVKMLVRKKYFTPNDWTAVMNVDSTFLCISVLSKDSKLWQNYLTWEWRWLVLAMDWQGLRPVRKMRIHFLAMLLLTFIITCRHSSSSQLCRHLANTFSHCWHSS